MKSALGWFVVVILFCSSGGMVYTKYQELTRHNAYASELAAHKRDFLVQSVGLRLLENEDYLKEVLLNLSRYHAEITKLAKTYPELYDPERQLKDLETKEGVGKLEETQKQARTERIHLSLELYKKMQTGQYRPLFTMADQAFRFDILDISQVKEGADTVLRLSFVHWGNFGQIKYLAIEGDMKAPLPEKGKLMEIPKFTAENQPPVLAFTPERFVDEFIPGVEMGYYDLPLLPSQAESITLSFDYALRTIGGTNIPVSIVFTDLPIQSAWKMPEGQEWAAQERTATPLELEAAGKPVDPRSRP